MGLYVISLAVSEGNLLEIYDTVQWIGRPKETKNLHIVGVALGKSEAVDLVAEIVDSAYQATKALKISDYIRDLEKNKR